MFRFQKRSPRMRFHTEMKGIRVLGIAESFRKTNACSTLAGIVMRRDLVIDGMVFGNVRLQEMILHKTSCLCTGH